MGLILKRWKKDKKYGHRVAPIFAKKGQNTNPTDSVETAENPPEETPVEKNELTETTTESNFSDEISAAIAAIPPKNIKGAGSTQENRCTPEEIKATAKATASAYGIAYPTAITAIGEMIRRGGANASTPESFTVEIRCPEQGNIAIVEKRDIRNFVTRHANGKNFRNLAEGMAEGIVKSGVRIVKADPSIDRAGDLAKKVNNRLVYKKETPLTPLERVGCASFAQWLPNLDVLVESDRLSGLLAEDLEIRKSGSRHRPTTSDKKTDELKKPTRKGGGGKEKRKSRKQLKKKK